VEEGEENDDYYDEGNRYEKMINPAASFTSQTTNGGSSITSKSRDMMKAFPKDDVRSKTENVSEIMNEFYSLMKQIQSDNDELSVSDGGLSQGNHKYPTAEFRTSLFPPFQPQQPPESAGSHQFSLVDSALRNAVVNDVDSLDAIHENYFLYENQSFPLPGISSSGHHRHQHNHQLVSSLEKEEHYPHQQIKYQSSFNEPARDNREEEEDRDEAETEEKAFSESWAQPTNRSTDQHYRQQEEEKQQQQYNHQLNRRTRYGQLDQQQENSFQQEEDDEEEDSNENECESNGTGDGESDSLEAIPLTVPHPQPIHVQQQQFHPNPMNNNHHPGYSDRSQLSKSVHHQLDQLQQELTMNDRNNTQSNERNNNNNNIPFSGVLTEEHVDELLFKGGKPADNRYQKEVDASSPSKKVTPGSLPSSPSSSLKQPRTFLTETVDEDDDHDEDEDGRHNQGIYPDWKENEEEEEEIRPTEDPNSSFVLQQQKSSKASKSKSRSQPSSLSSSPNRQPHQQPATRSIPVSMVSSSLEEMKKNFFQEMESKWNNNNNKHHSSSSASSPLSTPRTSTATTNLLLKDANIPSAASYDLPRALKEIEKLNRIKESLLDTLFENKQYIHHLQDLFQQEKENQLEKSTEYDLSIENYQLEIKHLQKQLKALSANNNLTEIYAIFEKDCLRLHKENELLREQLTSLELKELSAVSLPVAAPEERRSRSRRKASKETPERSSSSPAKTIGTNIGKGDKKFVMARIKESKSFLFPSFQFF
jgi:cation transport regulator ChaB